MDCKMDEGVQRENRRHRIDYYKGGHLPWNMLPQYQAKEQNSFSMNTKISMIYAERDAAIEERDRALAEKKAALEERDLAIVQRDAAVAERDNAIRERDSALAALHFQENTMSSTLGSSVQRATKRGSHSTTISQSAYNTREVHDALPISSAVSAEAAKSCKVKRTKVNKSVSPKSAKSPRKVKKIGEDLNKHVTTDGSKAEWDAHDFGAVVPVINFDESTMPVPVCSCTGVPRHCYKWGNGGWQSSCCTTSLSVYPLPQLPHKRHARIGGRKMSGSVFTRLLTRLAAAGHDLSVPLDLRNYWAKHGTNRYITIK